MLTSTYALVAFSVEQTRIRNEIHACRAEAREHVGVGAFEAMLAALERVQRACQWRKLELYLLPALRQASGAAEQALQEVGTLGQRAAQALATLRGRVADATPPGAAALEQGIEQFCSLQLERLTREEHTLFPLAVRVITNEIWFAIARQLMLCDSGRPHRPRRLAPALAALPL